VPFLTSHTVTADEAIRIYREAKAARLVPATLTVVHQWEFESRQPITGGFRIYAGPVWYDA
jgi:hypothetical protein